MLQKVVVVELPSPYKNTNCWRCKQSLTAPTPLCNSCQALQPIPYFGLNYFSIFEYPPTLKINDEELRARFYNLSKMVHPDRYVNVPNPEKEYSQNWSAYLNKAHQTLREPKARAEYLLELYKIPPQKTTKVPTDLAETYFELQDLLMDSEARGKLIAFRKTLGGLIDAQEKEFDQLAEVWEKTNAKEQFLLHLQDFLNKHKYLLSMLRDLELKIGKPLGIHWH